MIATKATTTIRPRLATMSATAMATAAAMKPPRDCVAASPSTRITTEPARPIRPRKLRTPGTRPAASAIDGTMPAAR